MDNKKRRLRTVHKKSRHGCVQCKRRHVKCDEQRPCGTCKRRGVECSLTLSQGGPLTLRPAPPSTPLQDAIPTPESLPLGPSDSMSNTSSVDSERIARLEKLVLNLQAEIETISNHTANTSHSASPPPPSTPPPTTSPPESIEDIRLFHHFCISTCKTLATEPSRHQLWSEFVPQLACTHPFLMHGLLAVSALHCAHIHPHQHSHYMHTSTRHQTLALGLFTTALPSLSPTTSPAFLLLSSFVFLLNTYPLACAQSLGNTPITIPAIVQSLSLIRGTKSLLLLSPDVWEHARSGPLRELFAHVAPAAHPRGPFVDKLDGLVDALRQGLTGTPASATTRVALLAAVEALRHTYALLSAARVADWRDRLWTWAVVVPEDVLGLLEEECPIALVVLAYFCVLVASVECGVGGGRGEEEQWFLKGWSGGVLECVVGVLEREEEEEEEGVWREWVEWPASCVRKRLNVLETTGDNT